MVLRDWPTSLRVGVGLAFAVGVGLCFSPLLGVHGVESALILGGVLPPIAAAVAARAVIGARLAGEFPSAAAILRRGMMRGLLIWLVPVTVLAFDQLRIRNCTPAEGLAFMLLGPGMGVLLASVMGVFVGALVRRPRRATWLAALVPLASIALGLRTFWSSPAIFVYDHFVGWFPGSLYDRDVSLPLALITFRLITAGIALTLALLVVACWRRGLDRLERPRGLALPLALLCAAGVTVASMSADALGHRGEEDAIQAALGWTGRGEHCVVHAPRELTREQKQRLIEDCDYRAHATAAMLDVPTGAPVHAYFYRSTEEKRRWMGAARVYIAKPWRREVHLQLAGWPHAVLAHEIVHVMAGAATEGPFRVSGGSGGWLPNPGLIEGIAVAIEWPERDGMNPHQFCRAMRELDMLPAQSDVMSLRFLTLSTRRAYAAAGSFTRWAIDTFGIDAVKEAHRHGDVTRLGEDLPALEARWLEFLETVELPEGALALTELRFYRASIFSTTCPHRVANLHQEMAADRAAGDERSLARGCVEALSIDAGDLYARSAFVGAAARAGRFALAEEQLEALDGAPPPLLARARESLADALWLRGERERAQQLYAELLELPQSDDEARAREVKLDVLRAGGAQGRFVRDLLVGQRGRGPSATEAMHLAERIAAVRADGLGPYLVGRQLTQVDRFDLARPALLQARERGLPTPRLEDERLRLEALAASGDRDWDAAERLWTEASERPRLRHEANDWLARLTWLRSVGEQ